MRIIARDKLSNVSPVSEDNAPTRLKTSGFSFSRFAGKRGRSNYRFERRALGERLGNPDDVIRGQLQLLSLRETYYHSPRREYIVRKARVFSHFRYCHKLCVSVSAGFKMFSPQISEVLIEIWDDWPRDRSRTPGPYL